MGQKQDRRMRALESRILIAATLIGFAFVPAVTWSGVRGTAHDFSMSSWSTQGDLCVPCHTSHVPKKSTNPLWHQKLKTTSYSLYRSPTMKAVVNQPSPESKICLSCHDGTAALNSFGGKPGNERVKEANRIGTDLSNDHPISFHYDSTLASQDPGIYDPAIKTVPALEGKTIAKSMLVHDSMECTSCHSVHGPDHSVKSAGGLLLINNDGSALCLTCHNK
jgi:predicted CXXCH cytochrome family protein